MSDFLYRGLLLNDQVRFTYALTTDLANQTVLTHDLEPVTAHLLCRAVSAAVLVAPTLSGDERYNLRWNYEGALKSILVDVGADADVRGTITPSSLNGETDEQALFGENGRVTVIKSTQKETLHTGISDAGILDVVEDLAYFFAISDQVETSIVVMISFAANPEAPVALCQGFMLQAMPDCDLEIFDVLRQRTQCPTFRARLGAQPTNDNYFELLLHELGDEATDFKVFGCPRPMYTCRCSREKTQRVLATLTREELQQLIDQGEGINVSCHFCRERYHFDSNDIRRVLEG